MLKTQKQLGKWLSEKIDSTMKIEEQKIQIIPIGKSFCIFCNGNTEVVADKLLYELKTEGVAFPYISYRVDYTKLKEKEVQAQ